MKTNNLQTLLDLAQTIKQKSTDVGFDTNDSVEKAFDKIHEEFLELKEEVDAYSNSDSESESASSSSTNSTNKTKPDSILIQKEMGDLMFAICALANKLGVRANDCLEMTVDKFTYRNQYVETKLHENGQDWKTGDITKMCEWWCDAKKTK